MIQWSDIYSPETVQEIELDKAGTSLLNLLPEEKRPEAELMLRGYLAAVRVQLYQQHGDIQGQKYYESFCDDMVNLYEHHTAGRFDDAQKLADVYGLPYHILREMSTNGA